MKRFVALLTVLASFTFACGGGESASPSIFAEPAGTTIGEATNPLEVREIMRSIRGETDDFASTVARLSPFPDIPTLSTSSLEAVRVELRQDFDDGREVASFEQNTNVTVWTDATNEDVLLELSTAFPAIGFEFDEESSTPSSTTLTHGDFDTGRLSAVVFNTDELGLTKIDIGYTFRPDQPMTGILSDHADWTGDAPVTDSITSVSMQVNDLPNFEVELTHIYWDTDSDDAEAQFLLGLNNSTWVENQNIDPSLKEAVYPDTPGSAILNWVERDDSSLQILSFESDQ